MPKNCLELNAHKSFTGQDKAGQMSEKSATLLNGRNFCCEALEGLNFKSDKSSWPELLFTALNSMA